VNTEITDAKDVKAGNWVFFDGNCPMCRGWIDRFRGRLERAGFGLAPLQSSTAHGILKLPEEALLAEMRVVKDGVVSGGADGLICLAKTLGKAKWINALMDLPGMRPVLRTIYRFVASNRTCDDGTCALNPNRRSGVPGWFDWLPLAGLVPATIIWGRFFPAWIYMWTLALALYVGCKWLSYRRADVVPSEVPVGRRFGYLLAWPGMDAKSFLKDRSSLEKPLASEWFFTFGKIVLGLIIWRLTRKVSADPLLTGWLGMIGLILILHFGLLSLVSLLWRAAGVEAIPLMREPLKARSLGELWGFRWNTGFHYLADRFVFRPLRPVLGWRAAMLAVFAVSGLIHDLVISVPARGGYGLPTAYFLVQGLGILFEHTRLARRLGVGRHGRGWLFTMIVAAGPAFWLFHPPFVLNVIVPFFRTIGVL
jgi:predicted DCC family thiol-disulfide oxidoreductase YuxK